MTVMSNTTQLLSRALPQPQTLESSHDEYEMETSYSPVTHEISCPEDEDTPSMYPHDHHGQVDCTNMAYVLTS